MSISILHWYTDPNTIPLEEYGNTIFRLYFDVITLSISTIALIVLLLLWIYELYFAVIKMQDNNPQNVANEKTKQSQKIITCKKSEDIPLISKIFSTLCIVLGILFQIIILSTILLSINNIHVHCIYASLGYEFVIFQRLCLYLYYLFRVYSTIKGSVYETNKKKLINISIILSILWIFGGIFFLIYSSILKECDAMSIVLGIIPIGIFEGVVSIGILLFFISKLKKIVIKTNNELVIYELKYILSKITIITVFTVCTTYALISVFLFTFSQGVFGIDILINNVCLMLSFSFNEKYYRLLCSLCRKYCEPSIDDIDDVVMILEEVKISKKKSVKFAE